MYCVERDNTPSTPSSSRGCSRPSTASTDLPPSPFNQNSWLTLQSQSTKEVLQSVLRSRKTWKSLRGGETVWPLELEAALLEGLEHYQPDDSRETRMLGRFPRRNRFISDYIFDKTGKRRSPKQVGSRLQQLRESCGGQQLLHLLSPFRSPAPSAHSASADGTVHRLTPPVDGGLLPGSLSPSHVVMYIDILPQGSPERSRPGSSSSAWSDAGDVVRASEHPRPLESINPTICFTSTSSMVAHSRFTVYSEDLILHAETVPLLPLEAQAPQTSGVLYSTLLVPKYWKVILDSPDPTRFTIFQEVLKENNSTIIFSATYKFKYSTHLPSSDESPFASYAPMDEPASDITPCGVLAPLPATRYPQYDSIQANSPLPKPPKNSPVQGYSSPAAMPEAQYPPYHSTEVPSTLPRLRHSPVQGYSSPGQRLLFPLLPCRSVELCIITGPRRC
ncbi:hypothetical protein B0H13DRAFT_2493948 [Mycena leptocephala]|nr:hypothetical protein B0H13DRAFT_2493948 [Mycena leptocephala]